MHQDYLRLVDRELPAGVELWWADLDRYASAVPLDALPADDRERAARLAPPETALRLLAARHLLRSLLAATIGGNEATVNLVYSPRGKPRLAAGGPHFNLSHSGPEGLVGICHHSPIGVDLEVVRPVPEARALAGEHFTGSELAAWRQTASADRDACFLTCWTRKEACAKAVGEGLWLRPAMLDVGCSTDARVVRLSVDGTPHELELCSVTTPGASVAAVALARHPVTPAPGAR